MKIKIEENVKTQKEVEVEFPIYRKHWLDNSTIYMKVESQEKQINIHIYDDEKKIELEIKKPSFWGGEDYLLGKGEYKSSEEDFKKAANTLNELILCVG